MRAAGVLAVGVLLALASTGHAQGSGTTGSDGGTSPIVQYLSSQNSTLYSYFWLALQAGNMDQYLSDPSLQLTIFAPTNDAWVKRLPTLTSGNGITVQQLFSQSKSAAMQSMLQYHVLNTPKPASSFKNGDFLQTLSNLCSDAKTLSIAVNGSAITLLGAGGTRPRLLDRGIIVGSQYKSIVYPIDDVLLPSVVTIPIGAALANFNTTAANPYSPTIARQTSALAELQNTTVGRSPAPINLAPATAPAAGSTTG